MLIKKPDDIESSEITDEEVLLEPPHVHSRRCACDNREFSTIKDGVAPRAKDFVTRPWTVEVGGMVHKPVTKGVHLSTPAARCGKACVKFFRSRQFFELSQSASRLSTRNTPAETAQPIAYRLL